MISITMSADCLLVWKWWDGVGIGERYSVVSWSRRVIYCVVSSDHGIMSIDVVEGDGAMGRERDRS
jgi:hypothetical protein